MPKKPNTKVYRLISYSYDIQEQAKLIYGNRNQNNSCCFTGKGHEGTSQSDDNVLHLDLAEVT